MLHLEASAEDDWLAAMRQREELQKEVREVGMSEELREEILHAQDQLRLFTVFNNPGLRRKFCQRHQQAFPDDKENGCPDDQPPPATIVTPAGDVPLIGAWPSE
jgi:hypothetical protein